MDTPYHDTKKKEKEKRKKRRELTEQHRDTRQAPPHSPLCHFSSTVTLYIIREVPMMEFSTMGSMKVHQYARGLWEHEPSLSLGCKRLRPLAPKLPNSHSSPDPLPPLDLKTFIRPDSGPIKLPSSHHTNKHSSPQVETHPGGTRWNPTQEQIGILEMLYRGGMRTPNAHQIEQITAQLGKYGKIEGKNVFYWFQNHKARERQKLKRNSLGLSHTPRTHSSLLSSTPIITTITLDTTTGEVVETEEDSISPYKKKCRSWAFEGFQGQIRSCKEEQQHTTLELFPLHPEGR